MAKATIHDLAKTMKQNIDQFYDNASVYRTNKYFVGFFGDYVELAVSKMGVGASKANVFMDTHVQLDAFNNWKQLFYYKSDKQVDMKWACADITIPHTTSKIDTPSHLDAIKSLKYPIITGVNNLGEVKIKVRDDKHMMWYQFFNALNNCFYRSQVLKPRSSFQKVNIYVAPIQEQFVDRKYNTEFKGKIRNKAIDATASQVFEFNSAVLESISSMTLKNDSKEILEYTVIFKVPNTFQGSFNGSYEGLRDNTTMDFNEAGTTYSENLFTLDKDQLKSKTNGYWSDD